MNIQPFTQKLNVINVLPIDSSARAAEREVCRPAIPEELPIVTYQIFLAMAQRPHENLYDDMLKELNSIYPNQATTIRVLLPSFLRLFHLLESRTHHKQTKRKLQRKKRVKLRHARLQKRTCHSFAAGGTPFRSEDVDSEISDEGCDLVRTSSCWRICSKVFKLCKH